MNEVNAAELIQTSTMSFNQVQSLQCLDFLLLLLIFLQTQCRLAQPVSKCAATSFNWYPRSLLLFAGGYLSNRLPEREKQHCRLFSIEVGSRMWCAKYLHAGQKSKMLAVMNHVIHSDIRREGVCAYVHLCVLA